MNLLTQEQQFFHDFSELLKKHNDMDGKYSLWRVHQHHTLEEDEILHEVSDSRLRTSTVNVGLHLKNIYSEGELSEEATTEDYSVVRKEGSRNVKQLIKHYNLDAIISVGYRINSKKKERNLEFGLIKYSKNIY